MKSRQADASDMHPNSQSEIDEDIEEDTETIETDPDENVHHPILDDDAPKGDIKNQTHQDGFNYRQQLRSRDANNRLGSGR